MNILNHINRLAKRFVSELTVFTGVLTVVAYAAGLALGENPYVSAVYVFVALLCGVPILSRAVAGIQLRVIGIEVLVSIAVIGALFIGEYSEAGIVTFLFQLGGYLEQRTLEKTRHSIRALTEMAPAVAWRVKDGDIAEVFVEEVERRDILLVKTGAKIPVDGKVTKGEGYVNEASITGESAPVHKRIGDTVFAGTILDSGTCEMEATKVGEDTTFAKIIALVEEAQDAKSPAEKFIDRFAKWYTPAVAVIAIILWIILRDIPLSITVLVLACPGALVIGAPVANVAGIGRGAHRGILLKGGESIHIFAKTNTMVFDKTGTLTEGRPGVTEIRAYAGDKNKALRLTAAAEGSSDHPLALAIRNFAQEQNVMADMDYVHSTAEKGMGIRAETSEGTVLVGSGRWMEKNGVYLTDIQQKELLALQQGGATTVLSAVDGQLALIFAITDVIKAEAREAIVKLKDLGIRRLIMLTGDNKNTARAVAEALGIDEVQAELLPQEKLAQIKKLQRKGHIVAYVGDGINDSPALVAADTGIAMGNGTDVAVETSDVVLMRSNLNSLADAYSLARQTVNITRQNMVIAVGTVVLLLIGLIAGYIHMASGMFIHEASILLVILNAIRLLRNRKER